MALFPFGRSQPKDAARLAVLEAEIVTMRGQLTEAAAERMTYVASPSQVRSQTTNTMRRTQEMQILYESYLQTPPLSAPIDTIAKRMTSGGIELEPLVKGASTANRRRAENLLLYCNDEEDIVELAYNAIQSMLIFGAGMWEVVDLLGIPYQLYLADAVTVLPQFDAKGAIIGYVQRLVDGTTAHLDPTQIVRFALRGPRGETLSPIQKLRTNAVVYQHMRRWQQKFFEHGARPDGYIELPERTTVDDAERQELHFTENYSGVENAGTWPVLYGGAALKGFPGSSAIDLDFLKGIDEVSMEILQVLGVPLSQMGVSRGGGLANEGESFDKAFRNNTINPIRRLFEEKATYRILNQGFGITDWGIRLREANYDNDQLLVQLVVDKVKAGLVTFDEGRKQLGEDGSLPGGGGAVAAIQLSREVVPVSELADPNFHSSQFQQSQQAATGDEPDTPGQTEPAPEPAPQPDDAPKLPKGVKANEALADLSRWQRIALKDVRNGRPVRSFASASLDPHTGASVAAVLEFASSESDIREIFDAAFAHLRGDA